MPTRLVGLTEADEAERADGALVAGRYELRTSISPAKKDNRTGSGSQPGVDGREQAGASVGWGGGGLNGLASEFR